jgi:succinate-acetate transporter protein
MATPASHLEFPQSSSPNNVVFLRPIAAPSILGLYGFAGATFIVAAYLADWYGGTNTALFLFPFAAIFGGVAQFSAGMWAYRARDGLATAMHGMWGSFWIAYGILYLLFATGTLTPPTGTFPALGFWFIVLAAITWAGTVAAIADNALLVTVLGLLAAGSTVAAVGYLTVGHVLPDIAGYLFIGAALCAFYLATALMLEESFGRPMLPIGKSRRYREAPGLAPGTGEPGVRHGQ